MTDVKAKQKNLEGETTEGDQDWEDVESANFIRFEAYGDSCEGQLLDKDHSEQFGFGLFTLMNKEGEQIRFHGSAQLDDLLLGIQIGDYIRVVYEDEQKTPRGSMKLFKVQKAKGN